ncbi:unnamed protein product [marine sediment metagenome]|uniref:2-dehydro-3-deoxy-phosphogluconate aldolase n=1 Tax=marine sediment metagenome TaxID=412755 RepID=X1B7Q3_9ZZZZ
MNPIFEKITNLKIIPVIKIEKSNATVPLGEALIKGGMQAIEITYRTDAAEKVINIVRKRFPDILLGAGTILTIDQVKSAMNAGAQFLQQYLLLLLD